MDEAVDTHRDSSGQAPMARVGDVSGDAGRWMGRSLTVAMSKVRVSSRLQDKGLCRLSENDLGSKESRATDVGRVMMVFGFVREGWRLGPQAARALIYCINKGKLLRRKGAGAREDAGGDGFIEQCAKSAM